MHIIWTFVCVVCVCVGVFVASWSVEGGRVIVYGSSVFECDADDAGDDDGRKKGRRGLGKDKAPPPTTAASLILHIHKPPPFIKYNASKITSNKQGHTQGRRIAEMADDSNQTRQCMGPIFK